MTDNVADQLRRRRSASYRMTALEDGRRDPLTPTPPGRHDTQAARRAWWHLRDQHLLSDVVTAALGRAA